MNNFTHGLTVLMNLKVVWFGLVIALKILILILIANSNFEIYVLVQSNKLFPSIDLCIVTGVYMLYTTLY